MRTVGPLKVEAAAAFDTAGPVPSAGPVRRPASAITGPLPRVPLPGVGAGVGVGARVGAGEGRAGARGWRIDWRPRAPLVGSEPSVPRRAGPNASRIRGPAPGR